MKKYIKLYFLLLLIPMIGNAQKVFKCKNSTSYIVNQNKDFYCYIKLDGIAKRTNNKKIILFDRYPLQTLLISKKDYQSEGSKDLEVLTHYIIGEGKYFTHYFNSKLKLNMSSIELSINKKAVIWDFDYPETIENDLKKGEISSVKQISVSVITGDYIYTIGTTQFKDQSYELIKKLLLDLIKTIDYKDGHIKKRKLCNNNS